MKVIVIYKQNKFYAFYVVTENACKYIKKLIKGCSKLKKQMSFLSYNKKSIKFHQP